MPEKIIFWDKASLKNFIHASVQVVTTVMLYSRLIYLRGPFCMISFSVAEENMLN